MYVKVIHIQITLKCLDNCIIIFGHTLSEE